MRVSLARSSLVHDWQRFLPAALAVGSACLLQLLQVALVLGLFSSASIAVTQSGGQLWVGTPTTPSVNLGRALPSQVKARLLAEPSVSALESYSSLDASWRVGGTTVPVQVHGIATYDDALMFSHRLTIEQRRLLREPDGVIVDAADVDKLSTGANRFAWINGHRVHVVATLHGMRALGGANVLASTQTLQRIEPTLASATGPHYFVARASDNEPVESLAARICPDGGVARCQLWSAASMARMTERYWLLDTGAGAAVLFMAIVVFVAGAAIASQSLLGAMAGYMPQYATLNALGVGAAALRQVVMEQALWIALAGLLMVVPVAGLLMFLAHWRDVPLRVDPFVSLSCLVMALAVALISGSVAAGRLRRLDTMSLLR